MLKSTLVLINSFVQNWSPLSEEIRPRLSAKRKFGSEEEPLEAPGGGSQPAATGGGSRLQAPGGSSSKRPRTPEHRVGGETTVMSVFLYLCLSVFLSFSVIFCVYLTLSHCCCLCHCLFLSLNLFLFGLSLSLPTCLFVPLSWFKTFISLFLSFAHSLSPSLILSLSVSVSLYLFLSFSLSPFLSFSLSPFIFVFLFLSVSD